jgi:hypothetical protein
MYKALMFSVSTLAIASVCYASEMTWGFKSPAFHFGNGYSTHVLSAEQLKFNRQEDIRQEANAEQERIERELENSVLNKFVRNLESRIYATLSKQMVDAMFADCSDSCATSGSADIEGNSINWVKDEVTGTITLVVDGDDGYTEIVIPGAGEFNF